MCDSLISEKSGVVTIMVGVQTRLVEGNKIPRDISCRECLGDCACPTGSGIPPEGENPPGDENPSGENNVPEMDNPVGEDNPLKEEISPVGNKPSEEENPLEEEISPVGDNPSEEENPSRGDIPSRRDIPSAEDHPPEENAPPDDVFPQEGDSPRLPVPDWVFENREIEIKSVLYPEQYKHDRMIIDGPPAYGKSYFLSEICKRYKSDPHLASRTVCFIIDMLDFDKQKLDGGKKIEMLIKIANQATVNQINLHNLDDVDEALNMLGDILTDINKDVLLLLDSYEAAPEFADWFIQKAMLDLTDIFDAREIKHRLRLAVAGRYLTQSVLRWEFAHTIKLTPFSVNVIRDIIAKRRIDSKRANDYAHEIAFLSGGHPKIIKIMIQEFDSGRWKDPFTPKRTLAEPQRELLFQTIISPLITIILNEIDSHLKTILECISIFRKTSYDLMEELQNDSDGPPLIDKAVDIAGILAELTSLGLMSRDIEDSYYRDSILRQLFNIKSQFNKHANFCSRNAYAMKLYDSWIMNKSMKDKKLAVQYMNESQLDLMRESFYHFLHSAHSFGIKDIEKKINTYVKKLKCSTKGPNRRNRLKDLGHYFNEKFTNDMEIVSRLDYHEINFPSYSQICKAAEQNISQKN